MRIDRSVALKLTALTVAAVSVHGYHLGVDDAEIYVPGIKRAADPGLYWFGSQFFESHARLTFFPNLVGGLARWTHLPADWVILLVHVASVALLLAAAWHLARACFQGEAARWAAVALLAGALSIPVAGTALSIMDPYVTSRSLSTPATLFAIACYLSGQRLWAFVWLAFAALIHPQMSVYGMVLIGLLVLARRRAPLPDSVTLASAVPFLWPFQAAQGAAADVLHSRTYFFVSNWAWYEWLGIAAPLLLLAWAARAGLRGTLTPFRLIAETAIPYGLLFTVAATVLTIPVQLENYTRLQPMRAFHLLYVIFFVLLGGLAGEYLLRRSLWRWLALFMPLAAGMWILQATSYSHSAHVEFPGSVGRSNWTAAFFWIRGHTPKDAVFALDPEYMAFPEDDQHGFRAVAERSVLADDLKDSGAVSLFPQLADDWKREVLAQTGWPHFQRADFERLAAAYPVRWVITAHPAPAGLDCPYSNEELSVCRIHAANRTGR